MWGITEARHVGNHIEKRKWHWSFGLGMWGITEARGKGHWAYVLGMWGITEARRDFELQF